MSACRQEDRGDPAADIVHPAFGKPLPKPLLKCYRGRYLGPRDPPPIALENIATPKAYIQNVGLIFALWDRRAACSKY